MQPQCGIGFDDCVIAPLPDWLAGSFAAVQVETVELVAGRSVATCTTGIQRMKGVRSATSLMYQSLLAASQRAPSALTASFSAKGVFKLTLILWANVAHGFSQLSDAGSRRH